MGSNLPQVTPPQLKVLKTTCYQLSMDKYVTAVIFHHNDTPGKVDI